MLFSKFQKSSFETIFPQTRKNDMPLFNSSDYEGLAGDNKQTVPEPQPQQPSTEPTQPTADATNTPGLNEVKVTITGPISEIVARALNSVFRNDALFKDTDEKVTTEAFKSYSLSPEKHSVSKLSVVYCVSLEAINKNPAQVMTGLTDLHKQLSNKPNKDLFVYVSTENHPVTTNRESWFVSNAASYVKGMFFSEDAVADFVRRAV
jgi:hypothetical protein